MNEEEIKSAMIEFGLDYQVRFAAWALNYVTIDGARVLEVGGSLPERFCTGNLGAHQWVCIDSVDYWKEINVKANYHRPLGSISNFNELPSYSILTGSIEDLPETLHGQFDIVFSIAAFEHIHKLGLALEKMYQALKPGGKLFTMFSPVWSAYDGHHIPLISSSAGDGLQITSRSIPNWGHLTMTPPEMYAHLLKDFPSEMAAQAVYYIYHSPHVNRLFTDDYLAYFQQSPFSMEHVELSFMTKDNDYTRRATDLLRKRYPGRTHFRNNGLIAVLTRPV